MISGLEYGMTPSLTCRPQAVSQFGDDHMVLGVTQTFAALGLIWVITVVLAFQSAKLPKDARFLAVTYLALMLVLVLVAVGLVADHWYVNII